MIDRFVWLYACGNVRLPAPAPLPDLGPAQRAAAEMVSRRERVGFARGPAAESASLTTERIPK